MLYHSILMALNLFRNRETVRLWDGAAGLHIATLKDHSEPVGAFKLSSSPDSSRLADHGGAIL